MSMIDAIDGAVHVASQNGIYTPNESEPGSSVDDRNRTGTVTLSPPPESQPMTATASTISDQSPPDGLDASAVASYGTRSRHRSGVRPNYAEDKDIDLEIEAAGRYPKVNSKKSIQSSKSSDHLGDSEPLPTSSSRSGFAAINANAAASNASTVMSKETIPGTSSFSAQLSTSGPSKKRKQPGSGTPVSAFATTSGQTKSRHGAVPSRSPPETNMMSFERCGARTNNKGQLVADDGVTLAPNGMSKAARIRENY